MVGFQGLGKPLKLKAEGWMVFPEDLGPLAGRIQTLILRRPGGFIPTPGGTCACTAPSETWV